MNSVATSLATCSASNDGNIVSTSAPRKSRLSLTVGVGLGGFLGVGGGGGFEGQPSAWLGASWGIYFGEGGTGGDGGFAGGFDLIFAL